MAANRLSAIIELLKKDHREVEELFARFEKETQPVKQAVLASRVGQALTIHAEIEVTLLYSVVLRLLDDDGTDLTCEATIEHGTLRGLIAGINGKDVSSPMVKARVSVLKEYVGHHVREEEDALFPRVEQLDLDLEAMGQDMLNLQQLLTGAPASLVRRIPPSTWRTYPRATSRPRDFRRQLTVRGLVLTFHRGRPPPSADEERTAAFGVCAARWFVGDRCAEPTEDCDRRGHHPTR